MAKRLSKVRRAKALNRALVIDRAKANDDSHLLQRGAVQSPLTRNSMDHKGRFAPRGISLEGAGVKGRVVSGKLVRAHPGKKQPMSIDGFTADKIDAILSPHAK